MLLLALDRSISTLIMYDTDFCTLVWRMTNMQLYALSTGKLSPDSAPEEFADKVFSAYRTWLVDSALPVCKSVGITRFCLAACIMPIVQDDCLQRVVEKVSLCSHIK